VAEPTGPAFFNYPRVTPAPQGRQFTIREAGANTRDRIVPCDCIAANKANQPAGSEGEWRPARLSCYQYIGSFSHKRKQFPQQLVAEMVQEKIGYCRCTLGFG
jgi:hypothetical protein